jgi:hypothetical protein
LRELLSLLPDTAVSVNSLLYRSAHHPKFSSEQVALAVRSAAAAAAALLLAYQNLHCRL